MTNKIEDYIITKGGVEKGIALGDIQEFILTPERFKMFMKSMAGNTHGCLDSSCRTPIIYTHDLERFMGK